VLVIISSKHRRLVHRLWAATASSSSLLMKQQLTGVCGCSGISGWKLATPDGAEVRAGEQGSALRVLEACLVKPQPAAKARWALAAGSQSMCVVAAVPVQSHVQGAANCACSCFFPRAQKLRVCDAVLCICSLKHVLQGCLWRAVCPLIPMLCLGPDALW
jgi:hypothetical protein